MDAGEGLPGRWDAPVMRTLPPGRRGLLQRGPGAGRRGGRGAAPGGAGEGGVCGEAGADLTVRCLWLSALFRPARRARVTGLAAPRPRLEREGAARRPGRGGGALPGPRGSRLWERRS